MSLRSTRLGRARKSRDPRASTRSACVATPTGTRASGLLPAPGAAGASGANARRLRYVSRRISRSRPELVEGIRRSFDRPRPSSRSCPQVIADPGISAALAPLRDNVATDHRVRLRGDDGTAGRERGSSGGIPANNVLGAVEPRGGRVATAKYVCDVCGEQNEVGTIFCVSCHAFLAWDDVQRRETAEPSNSTGADPDSTELRSRPEAATGAGTRDTPQRPDPQGATETPPPFHCCGFPPTPRRAGFGSWSNRPRSRCPRPVSRSRSRCRSRTPRRSWTGTSWSRRAHPGGWSWTSTVDLLLPGTEEPCRCRCGRAPTLVPAQELRRCCAIRSRAAPAQVDLPVLVTVPVARRARRAARRAAAAADSRP